MIYVLFYEYVPDVVTKRQPYRAKHLELLQRLSDRGALVMAGAWANPVDGAALVFRGDNDATIKSFVEADPYVANGLVQKWSVREWTVVVGNPESGTPTR
ncbi:MAG: hypothetical protein HY261_04925 [Chloroflexi bacterium]|nr:hypothetical protein [Chloroflexota bacterium]